MTMKVYVLSHIDDCGNSIKGVFTSPEKATKFLWNYQPTSIVRLFIDADEYMITEHEINPSKERGVLHGRMVTQ